MRLSQIKTRPSRAPTSAAHAATPSLDLAGRILLIPITALVVARPLVFGEDPGLLSTVPDISSMILGLLWLTTALAWALWRWWARRDDWFVGILEALLLAAVGLLFISAETAAYRHPARLIAWEWLVLLIAFVVVRHVAASREVRHGLFAVLLATGAMLVVYGFAQAVAEFFVIKRTGTGQVRAFATFAHPDSYAGFLALVVPGLVGAVFVCLHNGAGRWLTALTAIVASIGLAAVWLTHSPGAILALLIVGATTAILGWRKGILSPKGLAVLLAAGTVLAAAAAREAAALSSRLQYWTATLKMIAGQPWFGVGPGNFGGFYPRYMAETAAAKIWNPHNLVLEVWATSGVFTLLALLAAAAAFGVLVFRRFPPQLMLSDEKHPPSVTRWEYYIGATVGLLLGFGLRLSVLPTREQVLLEGVASATRSVVWFLAFALFENIRWTERQRCMALVAGIAALVLHLLVSPGFGFPSVAGPLWIAVALTLASLPSTPRVITSWAFPVRWLLTGILGIAAGVYLVFFFYPVSSARNLMRETRDPVLFRESQRITANASAASIIGMAATAGDTGNRLAALGYLRVHTAGLQKRAREVPEFIQGQLYLLLEAQQLDPGNAAVAARLGEWIALDWEYRLDERLAHDAMVTLAAAGRFNPNDVEIIEAQVRLWKEFARGSEAKADVLRRLMDSVPKAPKLDAEAKKRKLKEIGDEEAATRRRAQEHRLQAVAAMRRAVVIDPTDAPLRFELAEVLDQAGDIAACRDEAREALRLDGLSTASSRRLADPQRPKAKTWADR